MYFSVNGMWQPEDEQHLVDSRKIAYAFEVLFAATFVSAGSLERMFILGNCGSYFCASVRCFSSYEEVWQRSAPWKTMKIEFVGLKLFSPTAMSPTSSFIMGIPGFTCNKITSFWNSIFWLHGNVAEGLICRRCKTNVVNGKMW